MPKKPGRLIDLQTFATQDVFPDFCVLEYDGPPSEAQLFSLSPKVMQWSDHSWIIDLQPCRSFWQVQQRQEGLELYDLFEKVISSVFGGLNYRCIFAHHPWPALIFLQVLKEKNAQGVYSLDSLFNQKRYKQVDWGKWFAPLHQLSEHLTQLKIKGFRPTDFRSRQNQMKRFVERMGFVGPFDLSQAEASAIARRFSGWIGQVWQWTFQKPEKKEQEQLGLFSAFENAETLQSFPWRPFELTQAPAVVRHLEYPIDDWSAIEALLQEDLHRLCLDTAWSTPPAQVTEMTWVLTLYNLKTLNIPLLFRHPYDLHADEKTGFKTALSQAYFAYLDVLEDLKHRDVDLDLPEQIPLVSWKMLVSGQIFVEPQAISLIPNLNENPEMTRILDLQNKLSRPIIAYDLSPDFDPARAFQKKDIGAGLQHSHALDPWIAASQKRPFFYYPQAKVLSAPPLSLPVFLERTAISWWEGEDAQSATRDYFLLENEQGQFIWAYKDSTGAWYQHGIYS